MVGPRFSLYGNPKLGHSTIPPPRGDPLASKPLTTLGRVDSITVSDVNRPLNQNVPLNCDQPSSSSSMRLPTDGSVPAASRVDSVVTRPELKEFCERMDWKGLMKYIHGQEERVSIQKELPGALKSAPDPGAMVLDAVEGFYAENDPNEGDKDIDLSVLRRICLYLLEQLMKTGLSFSEEVRERAKKLALEWKGKNRVNKTKSLELTAFLLLVATYSLGEVVDKEELVEYFFVTSGCRQAPRLCRSIGLGEKVHDLIQKLVDKGKQHHAVRFIFEFGLAEKFPPVPLLENYLKETKKLVEQVCIDGENSDRSLNVATGKETVALKSVIKVIKGYKLDIEYPHECLQMRLEQLEKQLADRKLSETLQQAKKKKKMKKKKKKKAQGEQQQDIESTSQQTQGKQQQYIESASQPVQGKQQHEIESASQQAQGKQQQDIESASQPVQGKQQHEIESASQQAQGKQQHDIESASQQAQGKQQHDIESASQQAKKKKQAQGKQQQSGNNKRPKTTAAVFPTATSFGVDGSISVVPPFQQSHPQPAGLLSDQSAAYSSSLTGPFGLAGPTPAVNPYLSQQSHLQPAGLFPDQSAAYSSSLTGPYGLGGPTPAVNPYLSQQSHLQPAGSFLDQSAAYSSSLTGPYGLTGPPPAVNPYLGSSVTALLGLAALSGFSMTPNPAASHLYPSGQQPFNGAYGLPPQYPPQ
ncbi:hypothetical protein V6N12_054363 [Hibiscus sabdariffa]|uniref:FRIGIDA-like protein n=1 Tax=Hibiscus sabdariffa TaxID=183260 RepID=A0ABR2D078_9ROSI